jgi:hypothetical protein
VKETRNEYYANWRNKRRAEIDRHNDAFPNDRICTACLRHRVERPGYRTCLYCSQAAKRNAVKYLAKPETKARIRAWAVSVTNRSRRREYNQRTWRSRKDKLASRKKALRALRSGRIDKQPCEICGSIEAEMHHEDYSKPLEVKWLCRRHHRQRDYEMRHGKGYWHGLARNCTLGCPSRQFVRRADVPVPETFGVPTQTPEGA